jgi:hypothetical protein
MWIQAKARKCSEMAGLYSTGVRRVSCVRTLGVDVLGEAQEVR